MNHVGKKESAGSTELKIRGLSEAVKVNAILIEEIGEIFKRLCPLKERIEPKSIDKDQLVPPECLLSEVAGELDMLNENNRQLITIKDTIKEAI